MSLARKAAYGLLRSAGPKAGPSTFVAQAGEAGTLSSLLKGGIEELDRTLPKESLRLNPQRVSQEELRDASIFGLSDAVFGGSENPTAAAARLAAGLHKTEVPVVPMTEADFVQAVRSRTTQAFASNRVALATPSAKKYRTEIGSATAPRQHDTSAGILINQTTEGAQAKPGERETLNTLAAIGKEFTRILDVSFPSARRSEGRTVVRGGKTRSGLADEYRDTFGKTAPTSSLGILPTAHPANLLAHGKMKAGKLSVAEPKEFKGPSGSRDYVMAQGYGDDPVANAKLLAEDFNRLSAEARELYGMKPLRADRDVTWGQRSSDVIMALFMRPEYVKTAYPRVYSFLKSSFASNPFLANKIKLLSAAGGAAAVPTLTEWQAHVETTGGSEPLGPSAGDLGGI